MQTAHSTILEGGDQECNLELRREQEPGAGWLQLHYAEKILVYDVR